MEQGREGKSKKENNISGKSICQDKKFDVDIGTLLKVCCSAVKTICTITIIDWNVVLNGPAKIMGITCDSKSSCTDKYSNESPKESVNVSMSPNEKEAYFSYDKVGVENTIEPTSVPWQNCIVGVELEAEALNEKILLDIAVNGSASLTQGCSVSSEAYSNDDFIELLHLFSGPFEAKVTINAKLVDSEHSNAY